MSQTYFRKKATPIKPEMFPSKYMVILDVTKFGLKCMTSNKSFDLQKNLDEADEHKLRILEQMANAYSREIGIHMSKGNRDHWLFTYEDPETNKIALDLVVSQGFLNRCMHNELKEEFFTAVMALAAFTYDMNEGGVKDFIPIAVKSEDIN